MNNIFGHSLATLISAWLLAASTSVSALMPPAITDAEMARIPKYCPYTQSFKEGSSFDNPSAQAKGWIATMGGTFWHIHHYCWALINFNRSLRVGVSPPSKRALLLDAESDFRYVIRNAPADFVLLPEVFTWLGRTEIGIGNPQEAGRAFARARELKPDYWPAYLHWAQYLYSRGKKAEAVEIVKSGLQQSPGAKPLLLLYSELGGKPGDIPPPLSKPEASPTSETPGAATDPNASPATAGSISR